MKCIRKKVGVVSHICHTHSNIPGEIPVDTLTWNICRFSSATRLRRRIVAIVTATVWGGREGGGEAEPLEGAPWCSSIPYSMETAPTNSVTWSVPTSWVGSSLLPPRRTLPLHLNRHKELKCHMHTETRYYGHCTLLQSDVHITWRLTMNFTRTSFSFYKHGHRRKIWELLKSRSADA